MVNEMKMLLPFGQRAGLLKKIRDLLNQVENLRRKNLLLLELLWHRRKD
jgi:hypothetical protein